VWNSASTNQIGSELERLLAEFKMSVANQPLNLLDFVPGGTAFVDITLTGDRYHLSRWLFLSAPSLSDHPYLYFNVVIPTFTCKPHLGSQRPVPPPPQIDRELFKAKLSNSLCFLPRTPLLTSSAVEDYIATISSTIANCAHASKINLPRPSKIVRYLVQTITHSLRHHAQQ
jgi:hypothetical protein